MSEPITHMDTDNYMTIHHKGTCYFDSTAHLMCFVHSIIAYVQCSYVSRCVIGSLIYNLNDKHVTI